MNITEQKLKRWASRKNLKKLHKALEVPDHRLRVRVVIYLMLLKDPSSLSHLKKLLSDPFEDVLRHAAVAIRAIAPDDPMIEAFEEAAEIKFRAEMVRQGWKARSTVKSQKIMEQRPVAPDRDMVRWYEQQLKRRQKIERFLSICFAALVIMGFGAIVIIVSNRLEWW